MFYKILCFSFVLLLKKKNDTKKLDPDASVVSSNNESEVPT